MEESSQTKKVNKKIYEIKTLPVPIPIEATKQNISIRTNSNTEMTKEEIINKAFKSHSQGNIQEAAKYYQELINQGFHDFRVFSNYGLILKEHGNLHEAEISTRKAIELKPNFGIANYNLGIILQELGRLDEAEIYQRKAIKLKPDLTEAHSNLAWILKDLGKSQEAFDSYLKVIELNPKYPDIYSLITRFLSDSEPSLLNKSKLKNIMNLLLQKSNIPHNQLFRAFIILYKDQLVNTKDNLDSDNSIIKLFSNDKLFINALKKIIFKDIRLEKILTKIRKTICYKIANNIKDITQIDPHFIIALGEQCFLNEYVYSVTDKEKIFTNQIINRCKEGEINELNISILACYFPLYKLLDQIPFLKSLNSSNQSFIELKELQILEPLKEIQLTNHIKKLGKINDKTSQKVKSQYEENPYPRWRSANHSKRQKFSIIRRINSEIKPNNISYDIKDIKHGTSKILIAGCGTGHQILQAQKYKNAYVTSIDLSLSSLSYAQRKINELGIDNVELIQMDILEVHLLKEKFDIIECGGVLHHMNDPSKGLKKLLSILKDNGFLKLGLYSNLARQDIIQARNYIATKNLHTKDDDIRNFREVVLSGKLSELNSLTESADFYTLSSCRDLCFHAQEHRFTLKQLREMLHSNGLKFLGFYLPISVQSVYKKSFPKDKKQTNLQNWARFEEKHPNTFRSMYQFWVCKTKI